jgi:hypothetical protein
MSERELLRDRYGTIVGQIVVEGTRRPLRDRYGVLLGWYDDSSDLTHDQYGTIIGRGNLLTTLTRITP